jgi:hypothetical protein
MNYYYIQEIQFPNINIDKLVSKLKKKLVFKETKNIEIITPDGMLYIRDDEYYRKKINYNNKCSVFENFGIEKYTLYKQTNKFFYTKEAVYNIPLKHKSLLIEKIIFSLSDKSKNSIVLEFCDKEFLDLYISSDQSESNHSLKEDISYFAQLIL